MAGAVGSAPENTVTGRRSRVALAFSALSIYSFVENVVWSRDAPGGLDLGSSAVRAAAWTLPLACTWPVVLAAVQRARRERAGSARFFLVHGAAMLAVTVLTWATTTGVRLVGYSLVHGWSPQRLEASKPTPGDMVEALLGAGFNYGMILLALAAIHYARASRDAELVAATLDAQLTEARLALLQRQLQPHFLFNALQAISTLLHRDPAAADRALVRLSGLLRAMLEETSGEDVSVATEVDLARRYVEIEEIRFGARLRVEWHVSLPAQAAGARVPPLLLLPLVENAVRHGLSPKVGPVTLRVSARAAPGAIELSVEDDGAGAKGPLRERVGLGNTRQRLRARYGASASLSLETPEGGGFRARLSIPQGEASA